MIYLSLFNDFLNHFYYECQRLIDNIGLLTFPPLAILVEYFNPCEFIHRLHLGYVKIVVERAGYLSAIVIHAPI